MIKFLNLYGKIQAFLVGKTAFVGFIESRKDSKCKEFRCVDVCFFVSGVEVFSVVHVDAAQMMFVPTGSPQEAEGLSLMVL